MLIYFYMHASLPFLCPLLLPVSKISHHPKCLSSPSCNWTQNVSLLLVPLSHCGFWWFSGPIGFSVVCASMAMGIWWFDMIFSIYSSWVQLSGWRWLVFLFFSFLFFSWLVVLMRLWVWVCDLVLGLWFVYDFGGWGLRLLVVVTVAMAVVEWLVVEWVSWLMGYDWW